MLSSVYVSNKRWPENDKLCWIVTLVPCWINVRFKNKKKKLSFYEKNDCIRANAIEISLLYYFRDTLLFFHFTLTFFTIFFYIFKQSVCLSWYQIYLLESYTCCSISFRFLGFFFLHSMNYIRSVMPFKNNKPSCIIFLVFFIEPLQKKTSRKR